MRWILGLICLSVLGCSSVPERVVVVPQEVKEPVPVRCSIKFPKEPEKLAVGALGPSLRDRVVALIQEGDEFRAYSVLLLAALKSCADDTNVPVPVP